MEDEAEEEDKGEVEEEKVKEEVAEDQSKAEVKQELLTVHVFFFVVTLHLRRIIAHFVSDHRTSPQLCTYGPELLH